MPTVVGSDRGRPPPIISDHQSICAPTTIFQAFEIRHLWLSETTRNRVRQAIVHVEIIFCVC